MNARSNPGSAPRPTLVVGTAPRVVLPVARSLAQRGIRVVAVPSSADEGCIPSNAIREFIPLPDAREHAAGFDAGLESAVRRTGADMLMACSDRALAAIARNYANLRALCDPACPPADVVAKVLDKTQTIEAARRLKLAVPAAYDLESKDFDPAAVVYPAIAKPKNHIGLGGIRIRYFRDASSLDEAQRDDPDFAGRYLLQQFVPGRGVGVAVLMRAGEPLAVFVHSRLKELPAAGGVSVVSESMAPDPKLVADSVSLLRAIAWEGVALVEFRCAPDGTAWFMEVNGRYWGSLSTALAAGVDFPYYQWQIAHAHTVEVPKSYANGIRVRWTRGAILRLRERLFEPAGLGTAPERSAEAWRSFRSDFGPSVRSAMWDGHNPLPSLFDVMPALRRFARSAVLAAAKAAIGRNALRAGRRFGAGGALAYAWSGFLRAIGARRSTIDRPFTPGAMLFVCSGNIMRSAVAAAVVRAALRDAGIEGILVESSGLHAAPGTAPDRRAIAAAAAVGLDLRAHRAKAMDASLAERCDAIFAMDRVQELEIARRFPGCAVKTYALGACLEGTRRVDIPDPFLSDEAAARRILLLAIERAAALARVVVADVRRGAGATGEGATKGATPPDVT